MVDSFEVVHEEIESTEDIKQNILIRKIVAAGRSM